jgi:predicted dehydrogenase
MRGRRRGALRYPNGATATVNATVTAYPGFAERIEYCGTLGTATLTGGRLEACWLDGRSETVGETAVQGGGADPMAFTHHAHQAVIEDFLDALRDGREPRISGEGVLPVQALHRCAARIGDGTTSDALRAWP